MSHEYALPEDLTGQLRLVPEQGQIWLGEQRAFLLQLPAFAGLRKRLIQTVGIPKTRQLLAYMGFTTGTMDACRARELRGSQNQNAFQAGPLFHALEGIAHLETVRMDVDLARDHIYIEQIWHDSFEADTYPSHLPPAEEPVCWMQTGHASGFNSTFFGRAIQFHEVECRAMGHAHCRIIGKPTEQWHSAMAAPAPTTVTPETGLVGDDPAFLALYHQVEKIAPHDVTVLLRGESGVGKERFARLLHQRSCRASGPFIAVNCAAIPDTLIESELFGVEKGAFTGATRSRAGYFEQAHSGTLFLDEIGALPAVAQDKLLRVLQEREIQRLGSNSPRGIDIRIISATNARLEDAIRQGRFREDLFYRINVVPLTIPALRERRGDIPTLIRHFVRQFGAQHNRQIAGFTFSALRGLLDYHYPGNIRELENIIERGVVLVNDGERIGLTDLLLPTTGERRPRQQKTIPDGPVINRWLEQNSLEGVVGAAVELAMGRAGGNISQAARLLGLTRRQLEHRLKKNAPGHPPSQ